MTHSAPCSPQPEDERCKYSEAAADRAVKRVFSVLGVDVDDPKDVEEFRKDLRFGQDLRKARDKGVMAIAVMICLAVAGAVWTGIAAQLGKGQ